MTEEDDVIPLEITGSVKVYNQAYVDKQEKRIAELEQKLEQTEKYLADYQFNYPTIKELQKEIAELKKKNLDTQDAVTMQMYTNKANKEIADKQLTTAKELLKRCYDNYIYLQPLRGDIEQFLNSEEKE